MGDYNLVFDIAAKPFQIEIWMMPIIILPLVGAFLVFLPGPMRTVLPGGLKGKARTVFSWFFFLFSTAISTIFIVTQSASYLHLRQARTAHQFQTVEGCLEGFHRMPEGGHDTERIRVGGRSFEYSDFIITPAFNNTESHGGPIHATSRVRIGYVGSDIVKLETIDDVCPRAPDLSAPSE